MELSNSIFLLAIVSLIILGIVCIGLLILISLFISKQGDMKSQANSKSATISSPSPTNSASLGEQELSITIALYALGATIIFFAVKDIIGNTLVLLVPGFLILFTGQPFMRKWINNRPKPTAWIVIAVLLINFIVCKFCFN